MCMHVQSLVGRGGNGVGGVVHQDSDISRAVTELQQHPSASCCLPTEAPSKTSQTSEN